MILEPFLPVAWIVAVALVVLVASVWRRRTPIAAVTLRCAAIVGLSAALLGVSGTVDAPSEPTRGAVVVIVDRSASMEPVLDEIDAAWWGTPAFAELLERAAVRVVDHTGAALDPDTLRQTDVETSPLLRTLRAVLDSAPRDVVLLTDGIDTTGAALASVAHGDARIHALSLAESDAPPDARLTLTSDRALVYAGQPVALEARVTHHALEGRSADLVLERDGVEFARRTVRLGPGATVERFEAESTATPGGASATLAFEAKLVPIAGEATASNNASTALVRVSTEPIRVLVLEGQPHWDTRFFVRAMRADGRVEVTLATTLENRFTPGTRAGRVRVERTGVPGDDGVRAEPALPTTRDGLAYYDIVVLGRGVEQFFPGRAARLIAAYAEAGLGSVVFLRGEPVASDEPEAVRALDALRPMFSGPVERRLGGADLRRFGGGFTLFVDDPGAYRRALVAPGGSADRDAYARSWSGAVRTLAINAPIPPGEDASMRVHPLSGPPGVPVEIGVRARDPGYPMPTNAIVTPPSGDETRVALTRSAGETVRASGVFTPVEEGVHRVRADDGLTSAFVVVEDRVEFLDRTPRSEDLRTLAERSGGVVFGIGDGPGPVLASLERRDSSSRVEARTEPVWDRWWLWGLIAVCLCAEWAVRRARGEGVT